jgi:hypothetical protein
MPTDHIKSEKRVAAGHLNGLKAKGTKTPEGKSRSALNAVKHGLGAKRIVLANENFAEFERLMDMFMTRFQPVDGVEYELIADVVVAKWRHRRACGIEAAAVDLQLEKDRAQQDRDYIELSEDIRCALAYQAVERDTGFISAMNRHGARIYREFHNGMKLLVQMQANRPAPAPPQNTSPNERNEAPCGPAPDDLRISQHTRSPQPEPRAPAIEGGIAGKTHANRPLRTPPNERNEVYLSEHKRRRFQLPLKYAPH